MYYLTYLLQKANKVGSIIINTLYRLGKWGTGRLSNLPHHVVTGRFKSRPPLSRPCTLNHYSFTTAYSFIFKRIQRNSKGTVIPYSFPKSIDFILLKTKQHFTDEVKIFVGNKPQPYYLWIFFRGDYDNEFSVYFKI